MQQKAKTVDIVITNPTFVDGQLVPVGTVLEDQEPGQAFDLVGAGKAALATKENVAAAKDALKAEAARQASKAAEAAAATPLTIEALVAALRAAPAAPAA